MRILIDEDAQTLSVEAQGDRRELSLYSDEAFKILARQYLRVGWNQKYTYTFSWMGRPIIQLPDDLLRLQEVIHNIQPDLLIETGVAHGGSLIYYASLFEAMHHGEVLGIDIEIRPHNRTAIEAHPLFHRITMLEADSAHPSTIEKVQVATRDHQTVMVVLDSNHTYDHVMKELEAYAPFVSPGSYIVATDGYMRELVDVPRGQPEWLRDNPAQAALDFVHRRDDFELADPEWPFNESTLDENVTHWPSAWLRRIR